MNRTYISNSYDIITHSKTNKANKMLFTTNMTSRSQIISNRLKEVLLDGTWIANTNYKTQITSVNWQQATEKIGNLNTIADLTYHINYYLSGLLSAFETGKLEISDKYSFDLPPISSQANWDKLVSDFLNNAQQFVNRVEQLDDNILDQLFIDKKYGTLQRNIEGVIEHSYYHLGQVVLLKKLSRL